LVLLAAAGAGAAALLLGTLGPAQCPREGCALTAATREFVLLKNREAAPKESDFDPRATLDAVLETGEDSARWSESRAAAFEGYVVEVAAGGIEASNCYSLARRDVHIHVARTASAPSRGGVVAEVTPPWAEGARARGEDWSLEALRRRLAGRRVRLEGWLLFDREHAGESENTAPGRAANWRATAWELHPVTRITILD
jgi:hypothetical protein